MLDRRDNADKVSRHHIVLFNDLLKEAALGTLKFPLVILPNLIEQVVRIKVVMGRLASQPIVSRKLPNDVSIHVVHPDLVNGLLGRSHEVQGLEHHCAIDVQRVAADGAVELRD